MKVKKWDELLFFFNKYFTAFNLRMQSVLSRPAMNNHKMWILPACYKAERFFALCALKNDTRLNEPLLVEEMNHYSKCFFFSFFQFVWYKVNCPSHLHKSRDANKVREHSNQLVFQQQSAAGLSRTLIDILYSACSLALLMAFNLTVYSFNKAAARCLVLSKCSLRDRELQGNGGGRHKEGRN